MSVTGTTFSAKASTNNTAELRALGSQINAAIASAGMVQTTDTGQVDWSTINWVTGEQTWGYEVWRFNDPLQATNPVFVKLVYSQPAGPLALNITAQVGTATDGAGNLTSAPNTNTSVTDSIAFCARGSSTGGSAQLVKPWYVYGDGSSLIIASVPELANGGSTGLGGLFILERARHTDGTPLGDGVVIHWMTGASTTATIQSLLLHNLAPQLVSASASGGWVPMAPSTMSPASGVLGTNMYVLPYFTGFTPRLGAPSKMVVGIFKADMPTGNQFALTHYGESGTFIAFSPVGGYLLGMGGAVNVGLGLRVS